VENTRNLIPKRGRAARLGERARGHQDAGATSAWLIIKAIEESIAH
jgi:dihydroxyacetone kinase-like protein